MAYHPFIPNGPELAVADHTLQPIAAHEQVSDVCLEKWVASGHWEAPCERIDEAVIDVIWVWVNGSDPLHIQARNDYLMSLGQQPKAARFREHDELRYSLRSIAAATSTWTKSVWHIITSDVPHPGNPERRLGLVPQWLDVNATSTERAQDHQAVNIIPHSDLFRLFNWTERGLTEDEGSIWRQNVLPTFNSFSIESQLPNLDPDIVTDNIVSLNDDQFLTLPMAPSTFHTLLYGPVLRFDTFKVGADPSGRADGNGEWRGLGWSAHLLNLRFGDRKRQYVAHNARSFSRPLLHEAGLAFPFQFSATPLSRFRGSHLNVDKGEMEVHTVFLATHWILERRREALLWSYIVAKWGGEGGTLSVEKKDNMWQEMGGSESEDTIPLSNIRHTSTDDVDVELSRAGITSPRVPDRKVASHTDYAFVSQDGYPQTLVTPTLVSALSRSECLGEKETSAWALFVEVLRKRPECGDAIIAALLQQEGQGGGLSLFLPSGSASASGPIPLALPLHLPEQQPPLPVAVEDLRAFAVRLLHRYSYAVGWTPARFFGLTSLRQTKSSLKQTNQHPDIALLCINDDLPNDDTREVEKADDILRGWFDTRWPERGSWEVSSDS
ncbi:hypothetical protein CYLTODRAFT_349864 [Cylindrobasidium torrendii FP15055 ss-10]|uniref:Stealth protein CR3 conserved region 3 domain-containing protein n=1 Tax=Cylindrobasidium torrendii FP15055 ss-10 TaxID=1314674 RepID=A0A0D7BFJ1_9AGAR|nr:hypothetical protein CYLTODRAFT_349864 [Cylindrobasidium torrendii FP15055 ss-10]